MKYEKISLKYFISFFRSLIIYKTNSQISGELQVRLHNGKLILATDATNYFCSDHSQVMLKLFQKFNIQEREIKNALILGFGTGDIANTIHHYFNDCKITGVEIDPKIINIRNEYFNTVQFNNIDIICADAYDYAMESDKTFDLIIVDISVNEDIPEVFNTTGFMQELNQLLTNDGIVFFIRPINNSYSRKETVTFKSNFCRYIGTPQVDVFSYKKGKKWFLTYDKKSSIRL